MDYTRARPGPVSAPLEPNFKDPMRFLKRQWFEHVQRTGNQITFAEYLNRRDSAAQFFRIQELGGVEGLLDAFDALPSGAEEYNEFLALITLLKRGARETNSTDPVVLDNWVQSNIDRAMGTYRPAVSEQAGDITGRTGASAAGAEAAEEGAEQ